MSATRDVSQKIGWSFSSFYRLYKEKSQEKPVVSYFEPSKVCQLSVLVEIVNELEKSVKKRS